MPVVPEEKRMLQTSLLQATWGRKALQLALPEATNSCQGVSPCLKSTCTAHEVSVYVASESTANIVHKAYPSACNTMLLLEKPPSAETFSRTIACRRMPYIGVAWESAGQWRV